MYTHIQMHLMHIFILRNAFKNYRLKLKIKVGCIYPMVVVSILPHAEFGPNEHQEEAHHFIFLKFVMLKTLSRKT